MKIKTRLIVSMAIFAMVLIVISASIVITFRQAETMNQQRDAANRIVLDTFELSQISNDYLLNSDTRQRVQWDAQYAVLSEDLARLDPATPEQQVLVRNIRENQALLGAIFAEISATSGRNASFMTAAGTDESLRTSWSRIAIANERIVFDSSRLSNLIQQDLDRARADRTLFVSALLVAVLALFLVNFFIINRRILNSVSLLENGMRITGAGNLDFRIDESGDDEFRFLASSFNAMTASRQTAENELRKNHEILQSTFEQLSSVEEELRENYEKLVSSENDLAENEAKYRLLFDNSMDAILLSVPDGRILSANRAACLMFQREEEEIIRLGRDSLIDLADPRLADALEIRKRTGHFKGELTMMRRDGSRFPGEITTNIYTDRDGQGRTSIIIRDITDRKMMEEEIRSLNRVLEQRVADRTRELNKSLLEKEVLLKEIHHRVKNNLQIVASLFSLQARYIKDESVLGALREGQNRVRAMALVHEKLYRSEDLAHIDLTDYVRFLVSSLFQFYNVSSSKIRFSVELKDVPVDIHAAIPIGLIVNELVSNSLKHAFPEGRSGEIVVSGKKEGNRIDLIVRDTGKGMPEGFDWRNAESLGLRLVIILTDQMNGTIEREPGPGTIFRITLFEKK